MNHKFIEVEQGVFQLTGNDQGDEVVERNGEQLYRFMDNLYIRQQHLHLLSPGEVTNLCRARSNNPQLIGGANARVKKILLKYLERTVPKAVFEIGAGKLPLISTAPPEMIYVLSDADPQAGEDIPNEDNFCIFSSSEYKLNYSDNYFDVVVAIFVFQFHVYPKQIAELHRCIASNGILIANVYRRPQSARLELINEFEAAGFFVSILSDPEELCKTHEYWIIGKNKEINITTTNILESIIADD
jgi:hypothetical protein